MFHGMSSGMVAEMWRKVSPDLMPLAMQVPHNSLASVCSDLSHFSAWMKLNVCSWFRVPKKHGPPNIGVFQKGQSTVFN